MSDSDGGAALPIALALPELAADINDAHADCARAVRAGFAHAARAGRLLLEAKARVGHGGWLPWLRANCACSERTAQAYMRVARRDLGAGDPQRVADLSFRGALAMLAAPKTPDAPESTPWQPPTPIAELVPPPGRALHACAGALWAVIEPSECAGFYYVTVMTGWADGGALAELSGRPVAAWGIALALDACRFPHAAVEWMNGQALAPPIATGVLRDGAQPTH
ncbi:MAG: DUF3102 domain-containing protein [Gemmatimonadaceae bacterium]